MSRNSVVAIGMFLIAGALALAQNTGRLAGKVEDSAGAAVPNATVELLLPDGGSPVFTSKSSEEGYFAFVGLPSGNYDLSVKAAGFQTFTARTVKIDPGRELAFPPIKLEVGSVVETVDVVASSPSVQTTNAEVSATVVSSQIANLPTLDRQMITLIKTQAGVNDGRGPTVINGLRTSAVNVTLDGINIQDNLFRRNSLDFMPNRPTTAEVAEFTITTSNANATVGGGAAQVIMVTPSGTNEIHGQAFWTNRNNYFAANDWFNNRDGLPNPFLNQNQYGGSVSGPIRKDRLFYSFSYEKLDARQQTSANRRILTDTARRGIFLYRVGSETREVNVLQAAGASASPKMAQILQAMPTGDKINNFDLGDSTAGFLRNTGGYSLLVRNNRTRDNIQGKVDYNLSTLHALTGTFRWNNEYVDREDAQHDSTASQWYNGFGSTPTAFTDASRKLLSVAWRYSPTATFTNEARFGFNLAPTFFGSTEENQTQYLMTYVSNPLGNFLPQGRDTYTFHYMDNASYFKGRHQFQFGFNLQQLRVRDFDFLGIYPLYTVGLGQNRGLTGTDLPGASAADINSANNLLAQIAGYVDAAEQTFNIVDRQSGFKPGSANIRNYRFMTTAFYFQDNWKALPRLTVTLGVRWEPFFPVDEKDSLFLLPRLVDNNPIKTLLSNSTLDYAGKSAGRPWYKNDWNNFAPNVGLAWDPFGDGKTAVRAGYMISFVNDNTLRTLVNNVATNDGLKTDVQVLGLAANVDAPPSIATPELRVPRLFSDNYALNRASAFGLPDPGLVTPYVQQWNFGVQREIQGNVVEVRYVGNHSTKLYRGFDFNQIDIRANGMFEDFMRAYNNGNLARAAGGAFNPYYNPAIPGSQPLTVIPSLPNGSNLSATDRGRIERGEIGHFLNGLQTEGRNGNFNFFLNPYAQGTNLMSNFSNATFHSLQVDVQRRMQSGLQLQGNYVFGKVLSDTGVETDEQFDAFLDINNTGIERARAPFDLTHAFKVNAVWNVPLGRNVASPILRQVLQGWTLGGFYTLQSGTPFSVFSRRATLNRNGRSNNNTANTTLTKSELDDIFQFQQTATGPFFVLDSARNPTDGRAVSPDGRSFFAGQAFYHPGPGTLGSLQRRMFSGPWVKNLDLAVIKEFSVQERHRLQLRMEAFNATNTPSWLVNDQLVDSTQFGRITTTFYDRRILQFGLQYRF